MAATKTKTSKRPFKCSTSVNVLTVVKFHPDSLKPELLWPPQRNLWNKWHRHKIKGDCFIFKSCTSKPLRSFIRHSQQFFLFFFLVFGHLRQFWCFQRVSYNRSTAKAQHYSQRERENKKITEQTVNKTEMALKENKQVSTRYKKI